MIISGKIKLHACKYTISILFKSHKEIRLNSRNIIIMLELSVWLNLYLDA